jgi:LysR family transcriptional regulator, glycine cleavage system transcriptional activator
MLTSMARLPLNTLPAFRAAARLGNLRAAAEQLNLTHSAVSQQIKLLEEQLGFLLFDRRGRGVVLNAAGHALLQAVEPALDQLEAGVSVARATATGAAQRIELTVLPSFAQRWLLPRLAGWHARHPHISVALNTSQQVLDLQREGLHAALRQGSGPWRGLVAERLIDSPFIALGSPAAARRLQGRGAAAMADEPLLGSTTLWLRWFERAGLRVHVNPVAAFNDAGMLLQAAEHGMGLALGRELFAADALRDGLLVRLSPLTLPDDVEQAFWLVYPPALTDWPPLVALRAWLKDELALSQAAMEGVPSPAATATATATDLATAASAAAPPNAATPATSRSASSPRRRSRE